MLSGPLQSERAAHGRGLGGGAVAQKLRFDAYGRLYVAAGIVLALLILYVSLAAKLTETSYQITRLQAQQADLLAQQQELRYTEASLQAPGQVQQDAART